MISTQMHKEIKANKQNLPLNKEWPSGERWDEWCLEGGEDFELIVSLPPIWAKAWMKAMPSCKTIGIMEKGYPKVIWSNGEEIYKTANNQFKHF